MKKAIISCVLIALMNGDVTRSQTLTTLRSTQGSEGTPAARESKTANGNAPAMGSADQNDDLEFVPTTDEAAVRTETEDFPRELLSADANPQTNPSSTQNANPSRRRHVLHLVLFAVVILVGLSVGLAALDR